MITAQLHKDQAHLGQVDRMKNECKFLSKWGHGREIIDNGGLKVSGPGPQAQASAPLAMLAMFTVAKWGNVCQKLTQLCVPAFIVSWDERKLQHILVFGLSYLQSMWFQRMDRREECLKNPWSLKKTDMFWEILISLWESFHRVFCRDFFFFFVSSTFIWQKENLTFPHPDKMPAWVSDSATKENTENWQSNLFSLIWISDGTLWSDIVKLQGNCAVYLPLQGVANPRLPES